MGMIRADHLEPFCARGADSGEVIFGVDEIAGRFRIEIPRADAAGDCITLSDKKAAAFTWCFVARVLQHLSDDSYWNPDTHHKLSNMKA